MSLGLGLVQTQKLVLTPQLQQALKILQLPIEDLRLEVAMALEENPFLDVEESKADEGFSSSTPEEELRWNQIGGNEEELWDVAESPKSLWAYLLEQLRCLELPPDKDMRVQWLIGALDDQGFLTEPLDEIASQCPIQETFNYGNWISALKTLQSFDPTGVGASSVRECLLIQLRSLSEDKKTIEIGCRIVEDFFEEFAHKKYDLIQKSIGCSEDSLKKAGTLIQGLNPHPASEFTPMQIRYAVPEVEVYKNQGSWRVRLLQGVLPQVKINDIYASAVRTLNADEDPQLWQGRLTEARQLVKSITQRQETLIRVAASIVNKQTDFFNEGPEKMHPLVLRQVAEELSMHESTVSRVTRGKYLSSPQGIFELRYFFSSFIHSSSDNENISATAAKAELKKLLAHEDERKPFSDEKLSRLLDARGIRIARRTVAKYREAIGYPSASLRKKL